MHRRGINGHDLIFQKKLPILIFKTKSKLILKISCKQSAKMTCHKTLLKIHTRPQLNPLKMGIYPAIKPFNKPEAYNAAIKEKI
jgi:hypothetical protein